MTLCQFKTFSLQVEATRMSGEMCTSLGNGFSNLMFMLFLCKRKGCTDVAGIVEGDDGLFTMEGIPPSTADFAELGLIIKCDIHEDISTASFCGLIFDPTDRVNITDPKKVLADFSWVSRQYSGARESKLRMLLRCKAMSLAHQYPGCPVIVSLARYGLRCTPVKTPERLLKFMSQRGSLTSYQMRKMTNAILYGRIPCKEIPMDTRLLVERQFGFSVEGQLSLEKYLDSLNRLQPLDHWTLDSLPQLWRDHFDRYSFRANRSDKMLNCMPLSFPHTGQSVEWMENDMPKFINHKKIWTEAKLFGAAGNCPVRQSKGALENA
jgi:hypothetical protein